MLPTCLIAYSGTESSPSIAIAYFLQYGYGTYQVYFCTEIRAEFRVSNWLK